VQYEDGIPPTELFPTRAEVENSNRRVLASLKGKTMIFDAKDLGHPTQLYLLENTMAPKRLVLKEGANVMMLKNKDDTLVNGSVGTVITFLPKMVFDTINAKFHQLQLTQEALIQEIKALSQCHGQSETSKEVEDFAAKSVLGPSEFFKLANGMNSYEPLPVVKFVNRGVSRLECIDREDFKAGGEKENNNLERSQIPLLLSWALSIHKSQGQTLDRVKVDLTKVFEVGQVYTALSRATSRERLQVINFQRSKIHTHEKVKTFYQRLQSFDN
jgi:ATP-dependent DNA helicase PIF1